MVGGSNDAGGSEEYENRGLYQYQPKYSTPTTLHNNRIDGNLVHSYGFSHTDLGGVYTLSTSPSTYVTDNYVYDSGYWGLYNDEGSNSLIETGNILFGDQGVSNIRCSLLRISARSPSGILPLRFNPSI